MVAKESAARTALVMDSFFLICFAWFYMVATQKVILNPDNPAESRRQSSVEPILVNLVSYAGYIDTKEKQGIHLFFWFFKSESSTANTPLIVWLQGQQGLSCLTSLFEEHGPIFMDLKTYKIKKRKFAWTKQYHVLYLDPNSGCGFSYSLGNKTEYGLHETGFRILHALRQFLLVFPEMRNRSMYLAGEFDCCKYITMVAHKNLADENPGTRLNIKGLIIGGGFTFDFENPNYDETFHQFGLVDSCERDHMSSNIRLIGSYVRSNDTESAVAAIGSLIEKKLQYRGFDVLLDARHTNTLKLNLASIISTKASFKKMVHVGDQPFQSDLRFLTVNTISRGVDQYLAGILRHYKMLLYNGQFDLLAPYSHTEEFIAKLDWDGCTEFYETKRKIWMVNGNFLGYWTSAANVTHVMVRNAGHMVGRTQPEALFYLIDYFINNKFK